MGRDGKMGRSVVFSHCRSQCFPHPPCTLLVPATMAGAAGADGSGGGGRRKRRIRRFFVFRGTVPSRTGAQSPKTICFYVFQRPTEPQFFLSESTVGCKAAGRGEGSLWREVGRRVRERAGAGGAGAEDNKFHVLMRRNLNSEFQVGPETAK